MDRTLTTYEPQEVLDLLPVTHSLDEAGWSLDSGTQGPCIRHGALEHSTALLWLFLFFPIGPKRCVHLELEPPSLLDHTPGTWDPEFPTQWGSPASWVCAEPLPQVPSPKGTPLIPRPDRFLQNKIKKKKKTKQPTWSKKQQRTGREEWTAPNKI